MTTGNQFSTTSLRNFQAHRWGRALNGFNPIIALTILIVIASVGVVRAADLNPRSGHWQGVMKFESVSGCSAKLRAEIKADSKDEQLYSKKMTFPVPMNPAGLNKQFDAEIDWKKIGENRWIGFEHDVERTLMGKIRTELQHDLRIVSEKAMEQDVQIIITFPPKIARQFGASEPCVIKSRLEHRYISN